MSDLVPYLVLLGVPAAGVVRWYLYLRFCRHVFDKTEDAEALAHVAVTARAFREVALLLPRPRDKP